jgi:hypothetical protein
MLLVHQVNKNDELLAKQYAKIARGTESGA